MRKIKTLAELFDAYGGEDGWALRHELETYLTRKMPCVVLEAQRHVIVAALCGDLAEKKLTIDVSLNIAEDWDGEESAQTTVKVVIVSQSERTMHTQVLLSEELLRMALLHANRELPTYMG